MSICRLDDGLLTVQLLVITSQSAAHVSSTDFPDEGTQTRSGTSKEIVNSMSAMDYCNKQSIDRAVQQQQYMATLCATHNMAAKQDCLCLTCQLSCMAQATIVPFALLQLARSPSFMAWGFEAGGKT